MNFPEIYFPSGAKCLVKVIPWQMEAESEKAELIQKFLSENRVSEIFFYFPSESEKRKEFRFLIPYFRDKGIPYFPIDGRRIQAKEFLYYEKLSNYIRKKSELGNVMIVFPELESESMDTVIPMIFLRKLHTSPHFVLRQTLGRNEVTKQDQTICEYLNYLNPEYSIPTRFQRRIKLDKEKSINRKTKYPIRFKLLAITSIILSLSISGMIYFASNFFKETITVMVQDYNLNLSRLIGDVIESDLENLLYRSELFSELVDRKQSKVDRLQIAGDFFQKNPSVIYVVETEMEEGKNSIRDSYFNPSYSRDYNFQKSELDAFIVNSEKTVRKSQAEPWLENLTGSISYPMLLIYLPHESSLSKNRYLFVTPGYFLSSLHASRQGDLFELHLVDSKGRSILSSRQDLEVQNLPIVGKMLQSGIDNGSQRFHYQGIGYLGSFRILSQYGIGIISAVPEHKAFATVYKIERRNLLILIMVLSISFIFIFLFSKTLTNPIIRLVSASRRIEEGDFDVEIEPGTKDEIGLLTQSFRSMAGGLKEREKIKEEFGKFVNPEIAERALRGDISLGGERKECTVFFSDIRSFTALSESRSPEKVVEILNEYFTEMVDCVHITGGVVDKFIGDAVMAHWGAILPEVGDAKKAVDSALLMRLALMDLNQRLKAKSVPPIRIGCGINSGPVIAGQIGSQKRLEFTVIGDAVNLASRVEYLNKDFGTDILISESTYNKLNGAYDCIPMEPIYVRGKEKPQQTFAVLGRMNDETRPRSLEELRALVGIPTPPKKEGPK